MSDVLPLKAERQPRAPRGRPLGRAQQRGPCSHLLRVRARGPPATPGTRSDTHRERLAQCRVPVTREAADAAPLS